MPRISQEQLNHFNALQEELRVFDELRPFLHLAVELRRELEEAIDGNLDLTPSQIGDLAYQRVLQAGLAEARDEVVATYEQAYRTELYEQVVDEVEATEGPSIFEEVRTRLDTDPELARDLHDSVRRELGARAMGVVRDQVSDEQQEAIEKEANRQLELDRLDVELAIEGELDLHRDDINGLLVSGDTVDLFYKDSGNRKQKLRLKWLKDGKNHEGWVVDSDLTGLVRRDGTPFPISHDQYVQIGTLLSNLEDGSKIVTPNLLTVGMPLVLTQGTKKKQPDHCVPYTGDRYSYNANSRKPAVLLGTDFKTKDLDFFSASGAK